MIINTRSQEKLNCQLQSSIQQQVCQKLQNSCNLSEQKKKNKIPNIFKDSIRAAKLRNIPAPNGKQEQPIFIASNSFEHLPKDTNSMSNTRICRICETPFKNNKCNLFKCQHNQFFCQSCLHHYAIYKINQFQEAICPQEICNALIDAEGQFFKNLPIAIQQKYRKIQRFYLTFKDSSIKMCPTQNCEGFIKLKTGDTMVCNSCKAEYCGKCLLVKHEQECEKYELQFLLKSFLFRQCKRCKMMIQKMEGCNHMTCRCKYEFCYVCGADWTKAHYGQHDSSGSLIVNAPTEQQQRCCGWWCWNDCNWNRFGRILEECFVGIRFV